VKSKLKQLVQSRLNEIEVEVSNKHQNRRVLNKSYCLKYRKIWGLKETMTPTEWLDFRSKHLTR
jgi:hypothetical protein